ncbi:MAG: hypothetical protein V5A66_06390, partial [Candidatus Thermoplasmatota archaeon]
MRFRRGPRKASKIQKKNLIENAKSLAEDPMKVIPECQDSCLFCKFGRAKRKIKKIKKYADNERKLKKYAKRGPDLSQAVAGTILFGIEEEAKKITTAKSPEGEIAYAKKGGATKKRLVGVQHFDDPKKRLIAFSKESQKGYYFYSLQGKVVCTGKKPKPPKKFVKTAIERIPYNITEKSGDYTCGHITKEKGRFDLHWKSVDETFSICEDCAGDSTNLFKSITERMLSPDNSKSFSLKGGIGLKCEGDCESCKLTRNIPVSDDLADKYFEALSDKEFIAQYSSEARSVIEDEKNIFIIRDTCYGEDKREFLKDLPHEEWERPALIKLMKKTDGAVLDEGTVNEFLELYWEDYKTEVMGAIFDDKASIQEVLSKDVRPREKLRELSEMKTKKEEMKTLPEFQKLPPGAEFADNIARTYKVKGQDEAINEIENKNLSETRTKSIAYGFYIVFGKGDSKRWKYEDSEVESGEFLSDHIKELLHSEGEDYAEKL